MSNSDSKSTDQPPKHSPISLEDCGMAFAADVIGDRWSLLILRASLYGVRRFDDLKADLKISSATLTQRLTHLVSADLLTVKPYRDGNARTRKEYVLTKKGEDLRTVLFAMMRWADGSLRQQPSQLMAVSAKSGRELQLAFVDDKGRAVKDADTRMTIRA